MQNPPIKSKIVFMSTFPPTQCGIATFTQDLTTAIHNVFGEAVDCVICDLAENPKNFPNVFCTLNPNVKEDYKRVAQKINKDNSVKLVHIQHEFGLYGGEYGSYLLGFLEEVEKPVTFTFHSVIPKPNNELKSFVKILISYAFSVIVMTKQSRKILVEDYGISEEIIEYMPHGTHLTSYSHPDDLKGKYNFENRTILSTFGLLGEGKSIETALKALPEIIEHTPNVLYLVIGKTHPHNIKNNIDKYRNYLETLVKELSLENHVLFIDRYLEIHELLDYLKITDIYLFTSKDPNQAVSGTFSYAMSCACPIIATSIPHTREVLTPDTGILVEIGNSEQLAKATKQLLSNGDLRESMAFHAFQKTRESAWENIAIKHISSYSKSADQFLKIDFNYPPIKLDHIKRMTTKLGIIQFSKINIPDIASGYTLDDNARALIAMCLHYKLFGEKEDLNYINTYLNFIESCQKPNGTFINYVDKNGNEHLKNNYLYIEDSNTRAIWALGTVISLKKFLPDAIVASANDSLLKCISWMKNIQSPRSMAFATKGLYLCYSETHDNWAAVLIEKLAKNLRSLYYSNATKEWDWFEDSLTYANSILPEAMLYAHIITGELAYRKVATDSFDFLLSKMFVDGELRVISNNGWYQKNTEPQQYGEQPIDVATTFQTLNIFNKALGIPTYEYMMDVVFSWFLGRNHLKQIMYNPVTGGCYDGLEREIVNLNQGAESSVCYLMARLVMESNRVTAPKLYGRKIIGKINQTTRVSQTIKVKKITLQL
ncbi:MAG: glycosyltransferase [Lutibacter sp.]|jgi:glycosyltransferase involved in cell wall biosynthesis